MGKYLSVTGGIIAVVAGVWGAVQWWDPEMLGFLKACLVVTLILGGLLAFFAGAGEIKDTAAAEKQKEDKK